MTKVMGILNVTPDSFSDGGSFNSTERALSQAIRMVKEGADIIDVGGESTRPGAADVALQEELDRVIPVIEKIKEESDIEVSVDTSKAEVMHEALIQGADMVNDVRALQEPGALEVCAKADATVCLMHMQGQPRSMQLKPEYDDVVKEVAEFFSLRIKACIEAGLDRSKIILDPGFGFGKTLEHNLQLLAKLDDFTSFNLPILVGISRKKMIAELLDDAAIIPSFDVPTNERLFGSLSAAVIASMKGSAIIR
ncbi:MAG: dihydropteroate synthase, partial [Thiotrichaceae bacterium]